MARGAYGLQPCRDCVTQMVAHCIADLKERNGSSRVAIERYFSEKLRSKEWDLPENYAKTLSIQLKRCAPDLACTDPRAADVMLPSTASCLTPKNSLLCLKHSPDVPLTARSSHDTAPCYAVSCGLCREHHAVPD